MIAGGASPWGLGLVVLTPALVLMGTGAALGLSDSVSIILFATGLGYLIVDLAVLQPRLERRREASGGGEAAAQRFLQRALDARDIQEVAREFEDAVVHALGPTNALIIAPSPDGGVRVLAGASKSEPLLGDATSAFLWLGDITRPIHRAELAGQSEEGTADALALMDKLGAEVLLPLRHRGLLLGLAMIGPPAKSDLTRLDAFYRAMRSYTTVAVANTFLGAEARGKNKLAESLDLATAVQESLMPNERPVRRAGYSLRGIYRPVAECGGDLWAWRELDEDRVLLVAADATGHGAAPSLLAAVAKGTIDAQWQMRRGDLDPGVLLEAMNHAIHRAGRRRYLMTAFAAVVDVTTGHCRFANAGQNFPYVIGNRGLEQLVARGNQLGIDPEVSYEVHGKNLEPGDRLILFTDGFVEAGSPDIEPYGDKRFRAALMELRSTAAVRVPDQLVARVEDYLHGTPLADDMTCVVFELNEGQGPS